MITQLLLLLTAVIIETQIVPVAAYLIAALVLFANKGLRVSLTAIVIAGIILDILTPRHLGVSSLVTMLLLMGMDLVLGSSPYRGDMRLTLLTPTLIVGEGILSGRSLSGTLASLVIALLVLWGGRLTTGSKNGIIVRRQL